jgi:hypothetical protein
MHFIHIIFTVLYASALHIFPPPVRRGIMKEYNDNSPTKIEPPRFLHRYNKKTRENFPRGFYGLIGPNVNTSDIKTLFDLFTGDGIIQGVFMEHDNITFVKHIVNTDKWKYIPKWISMHPWLLPCFILFNKIGIMPHVLDLANTAFLSVKNKTYALFERDFPYEISIERNHIDTLNKIRIKGLDSFSGHSIYNGSHIHTIDYDILLKRVRYMILDPEFNEIERTDINTQYIPLVHDFYRMPNRLLFIDSPFSWDFSKRLPVILDTSKPAFFYLVENSSNIERYICMDPFYIFHYADVVEYVNGTIEIYASCYDTVDFNALDIKGRYRKMIIEPNIREVVTYKNDELERMNLDFPIRWREYIILREITDNAIKGFVMCRGLDIVKKISLPENRFFCGEPKIFEKEFSPFLIGISYDHQQMGYICLLNIFTDEYIEQPLNTTVTIGFHSILKL